MAVGGGIYFIFAHPVMRLFTDDPEVVNAGADALRALAIGLPAWSAWFVFGGALRGIGDTRTPMITSGFAVWGAVGLAYIVTSVFDRGLGAVWLCFIVTAPIAALVNWTWFKRRMAAGVSSQVVKSGAVPLH
jgi:Na+-driven multidrug efflux pump